MRNRWIFIGVAILFAVMPGFSTAEANTREPAVAAPAVAASNAFAGDLYGALRAQEGNLFLSPASISIGLAMGEAGARGETEAEMARTLHLPPNTPAIHDAFGALVRLLKQRELNSELQTMNTLWSQKGFVFFDTYMRVVKDLYSAQAFEADFIGSANSARRLINNWTAEQTNDRIRNLLPAGLLDSYTRMVLVNTIYFKARWTTEFTKANTEDAPFHLTPDQTVQIPMMHQKGTYRYGENETMQLLEKTYAGGCIAMTILLPRAVDGLPALERQFSAEALQDWLSQSSESNAEMALPCFRIESSFSLSDTLIALGMPLAFSTKADFSGISDDERGLYLSAVVHKAYIEVDEEGTEAASATGGVYACAISAPKMDPPKVFNADHPFLFVIRETRTGAIIFLGRVMNPAK